MIDKITYKLPVTNYIHKLTNKNKIIIGSTNNDNMNHYFGWLHRYNNKYKKTAHFTVTKDGHIYQHIDPTFHTQMFSNDKINEDSIIILVENIGWLKKDLDTNIFNTWKGNIYNGEVFEKKWRGYFYWAKHTESQINKTIFLVKTLIKEFKTPNTIPTHNTKINFSDNMSGIFYRSNISEYYNDVNPSWDFKQLREQILNI